MFLGYSFDGQFMAVLCPPRTTEPKGPKLSFILILYKKSHIFEKCKFDDYILL